MPAFKAFDEYTMEVGGVTFTVRKTQHATGGKYVLFHKGRYLARCQKSWLPRFTKYYADLLRSADAR